MIFLIMKGFEVVLPTPAALASRAADEMTNTSFRMTPEDERVLAKLDAAADKLGFIGRQYFVE